MMVSDGRKIAEGLQGPRRAEMLQLCGEVESLTDQLSDLCRKGMVRCIIVVIGNVYISALQ